MPRDAPDPYAYPGTDVLRNKPGIRDEGALAQFEYEQTKLRIEDLREKPISGRFDLDHLKAIHAHVFQDVYEWAGEIRAVGFSKGGSRFAEPRFIESEAKRLSGATAKENSLRGLDKAKFVERVAHYYAEWNALHPFRESNGRSCREFIGQIAREAGYELDQIRIENDKGQWNEAARRSFNGDLQRVKEILGDAIRPARSLAFEQLPEAEALRKHPELKSPYKGMTSMREAYALRFADDVRTQQQYVTHASTQVIPCAGFGNDSANSRERIDIETARRRLRAGGDQSARNTAREVNANGTECCFAPPLMTVNMKSPAELHRIVNSPIEALLAVGFGAGFAAYTLELLMQALDRSASTPVLIVTTLSGVGAVSQSIRCARLLLWAMTNESGAPRR